MGRGIAQLLATAGIETKLWDAIPGQAEKARDFVAGMLARAAEKGRMSQPDAEAATARLGIASAVGDMAGCGIVVEAIAENLEAKRKLFGELEQVVADDAILASNTSSLSITTIAASCRRPERVAGLHFFNPAPLMRVVEVIGGERTDEAVCARLTKLVERFGHRPVRAKDTPGFLVNHAGRAYGTEALAVLSEGVAEFVDLDRVMRETAGFPMGPFELLDLTGLDVTHPVMESIFGQFYMEPRFRPTPETRRRLSAGLLGRKTNVGFYRYVDGKPVVPVEAPAPADRPKKVWISRRNRDGRAAILARLKLANVKIAIETGTKPSSTALCLTSPLGEDATTAATAEKLDPARTVAVDTLLGLDRRVTLMANPLTDPKYRRAAAGLFAATGVPVTTIADSPGFIAQRILAAVVNMGAAIAQARIATPADIDAAVKLGLGYPKGPLEWGDALGASRILTVLENLMQATGDPRYRPSLWLKRRADLGLSLASPDLAP